MSNVHEQEKGFFLDHELNNLSSQSKNDALSKRADEFLQYLEGASNVHCKYCKGKNVTCRLLQTRSVDEGMSAFYNCSDCKKRWYTR